jgi:hypothetical protein
VRKEGTPGEDVEKLEPCASLVALQNGIATMENDRTILQNIKNRTKVKNRISI